MENKFYISSRWLRYQSGSSHGRRANFPRWVLDLDEKLVRFGTVVTYFTVEHVYVSMEVTATKGDLGFTTTRYVAGETHPWRRATGWECAARIVWLDVEWFLRRIFSARDGVGYSTGDIDLLTSGLRKLED